MKLSIETHLLPLLTELPSLGYPGLSFKQCNLHETVQHLNQIINHLGEKHIFNNEVKYIICHRNSHNYLHSHPNFKFCDGYYYDKLNNVILKKIQYKFKFEGTYPYQDLTLEKFYSHYRKSVDYVELGYSSNRLYNQQEIFGDHTNFFKKEYYSKERIESLLLEFSRIKKSFIPTHQEHHDAFKILIKDYQILLDSEKSVV